MHVASNARVVAFVAVVGWFRAIGWYLLYADAGAAGCLAPRHIFHFLHIFTSFPSLRVKRSNSCGGKKHAHKHTQTHAAMHDRMNEDADHLVWYTDAHTSNRFFFR